MKIVAGMGSVDDYEDYVKAGADEIFIGYVPMEWQEKYGLATPLNRREVCFYNVQIGSESELEILSELVEEYGVPVTIALNGLNYEPEQFKEIAGTIRRCVKLGFTDFIVADMALLIFLKREEISGVRLHISGELGEINTPLAQELKRLGMDRLIFHRKVAIEDMASIVKNLGMDTEYEAFFLNENCHFHGGFCNSFHCDELVPMCRMPYVPTDGVKLAEPESLNEYLPGASGCGFCQLWQLREAGLTHLKIVGRGGYSEDMIKDIRAAKKALKILDKAASEAEYLRIMKNEIFHDGCSKQCYY